MIGRAKTESMAFRIQTDRVGAQPAPPPWRRRSQGASDYRLLAETLLPVPACTIAGNTDKVHCNIVSKRVLELPPEPSTYADILSLDVRRNASGGGGNLGTADARMTKRG